MASVEAKARARRMLFVGGVADDVTEAVLHAAFIPFGEIVSVEIPKDPGTLKPRGFGFVLYKEVEDAADAIENMNDSELYGRVITVNQAKPSKASQRSNRAVWADADAYNEVLQAAAAEGDQSATAVADAAGVQRAGAAAAEVATAGTTPAVAAS